MRRVDFVHAGLLVGALALAYLLPFELLLLSYAILGPAHYFTEISWLHDRSYFLPHRAMALALVAATVGAMFAVSTYWSGLLLWSVLLACAIFAATPKTHRIVALGAAAMALTAGMIVANASFEIVGILLPTFIHVCIFTLVFMTLGALRARSGAQAAIVSFYLLAIAAILVFPPSGRTVVPQLATLGQVYFGSVAPALGALFGQPHLEFAGRITGLLSFVYTYHYLNWFVKADVIRWTQIPRARLAAIAMLSIASTGLYFYDYEIGLGVLLLVSLLHVLLEFPLNAVAFGQLAASLASSLRRSSA